MWLLSVLSSWIYAIGRPGNKAHDPRPMLRYNDTPTYNRIVKDKKSHAISMKLVKSEKLRAKLAEEKREKQMKKLEK